MLGVARVSVPDAALMGRALCNQYEGRATMARQSKGAIFVATTSFACEIDGFPYNVNQGERVRDGHPLLKAQGGNFERLADQLVEYEWETADAPAPVTRRGPNAK